MQEAGSERLGSPQLERKKLFDVAACKQTYTDMFSDRFQK